MGSISFLALADWGVGEVGEADEVGALVVGSILFSFLALEDIMVG